MDRRATGFRVELGGYKLRPPTARAIITTGELHRLYQVEQHLAARETQRDLADTQNYEPHEISFNEHGQAKIQGRE